MFAADKKSKLRKLTEGEKGYIAGMLDGEGHLYVRGEWGGCAFGVVRVRITTECVVKHLRKITGIGSVSAYNPRQLRKDGGKKRRVYEWLVVKRVDVRELLKAVFPHLVQKQKHAGWLLELESLKDQGAANGAEVARIRGLIAKEAVK